jgi:hypothetical protein
VSRNSLDPLQAALDRPLGRPAPAWKWLTIMALVLAAVACLVAGLLYARINTERERNIVRACQETNARHDHTIAELDKLIAKVPAARRKRAQESRTGTVYLIDALVPVRDCAALVRLQVKR